MVNPTPIITDVGSNNAAQAFDKLEATKVYVYELPNLHPDENFLKSNTHSLISAITEVQNDWRKHDIDAIVSLSDGTQLHNKLSTTAINKILKRQQQFTLYTNDYLGKFNNKVYAMTVGTPLDPIAHYAKEQPVFYVANIIATKRIDLPPDVTTGLLQDKNISEVQLLDFFNLEQQIPPPAAADIKFLINQSVDPNINTESLTISLSIQTLVNTIDVIGIDNENIEDSVEITSSAAITPILFNITKTQDNLAIYSPWLDYDITIIFKTIKKFYGTVTRPGAKISSHFTGAQGLKTEKLIADLLLITFGFADQWSFVDFIESGSDEGKIASGQLIGWSEYQASALVQSNKTAVEVGAGLYEKYLRENPDSEASDHIREIKQFIAALSRYISSPLAIANGNNNFSEAYLPFILRPFSPIIINSETVGNGKKFTLNRDIFFFPDSKYFNLNITRNLTPLTDVKLNELKILQTDRKIQIPTIDEFVEEGDKHPAPADIDPTSSLAIQYLFYTIIDPTKIDSFFGIDQDIATGVDDGQEINEPISDWQDGTYPNTTQGKNDLFEALSYDLSLVEFVSGVIENGISGSISTTLTGIRLNLNDTSELKEQIVSSFEGTARANVTASDIQIISDDYTQFSYTAEGPDTCHPRWPKCNHNPATTEVVYKIARSRFRNLRYITLISSTITESIFKRKAVFNKSTWTQEIKKFVKDNATEFILPFTFSRPLKKVKEIIIGSILNNKIKLEINGNIIEFNSFNKNNETIGKERILLL